jgi:hypothetical protein
MGRQLILQRARRLAPAILVGVALAGSLSIGFIPLIVRLHLRHRLPTFDARLVDLGVLVLNVALLLAFVTVQGLRSRRSNPDEASR